MTRHSRGGGILVDFEQLCLSKEPGVGRKKKKKKVK